MSHRWRVKSGDLDAIATAERPWEAFLSLVRSEHPKSLGFIAECESLDGPVDGDTVWYCSTERHLKEAGLWGQEGINK